MKKAFTLIELLVVISIIAVLVAFSIPVLKGVKKTQYISQAKAEMAQLETAIESYKNTYGFYPPSNPGNPMLNQLYYELVGTTNISPNATPAVFETLDGSLQIDSSQLNSIFGIGGFVNCSKQGSGEESAAARDFIHELKPNQTKVFTTNAVDVTLLVTGVGGPDNDYMPLGQPQLNPWRYISPGTNNPQGFDLWVDLKIGGQTNLVCNWRK